VRKHSARALVFSFKEKNRSRDFLKMEKCPCLKRGVPLLNLLFRTWYMSREERLAVVEKAEKK
jgi:hypothetical protein